MAKVIEKGSNAGERVWVLFRARKYIFQGLRYAEAMEKAEQDAQDIRDGREPQQAP